MHAPRITPSSDSPFLRSVSPQKVTCNLYIVILRLSMSTSIPIVSPLRKREFSSQSLWRSCDGLVNVPRSHKPHTYDSFSARFSSHQALSQHPNGAPQMPMKVLPPGTNGFEHAYSQRQRSMYTRLCMQTRCSRVDLVMFADVRQRISRSIGLVKPHVRAEINPRKTTSCCGNQCSKESSNQEMPLSESRPI